MVQEIWQKFNANERMASIGAGIVVIAWLVGIVGGVGVGTTTLGLLGAIALLAVLYLKYAPNQNITWPAPIPVILLVISAVVAVVALLELLSDLRFLGLFDVLDIVALVGFVVGAALMAWASYQEWQTTKAAA